MHKRTHNRMNAHTYTHTHVPTHPRTHALLVFSLSLFCFILLILLLLRGKNSLIRICFFPSQPAGHGKMIHANGDVYEGEFRAGLANGRGVSTYHNGDKFDGEVNIDTNGLTNKKMKESIVIRCAFHAHASLDLKISSFFPKGS